MSLIETTAGLILGRRFEAPEGARSAVPEGVVLRRGGLIPRLGGLFARVGGAASAVTLGSTIVFDPDAEITPELLAHEAEHVRQWRRDPLFAVRYTVAHFRYGYRDNPYEVEARLAAADFAPPGTGSTA